VQGGRDAGHQRHRGGDQEDVVHLVAEPLDDDEAEVRVHQVERVGERAEHREPRPAQAVRESQRDRRHDREDRHDDRDHGRAVDLGVVPETDAVGEPDAAVDRVAERHRDQDEGLRRRAVPVDQAERHPGDEVVRELGVQHQVGCVRQQPGLERERRGQPGPEEDRHPAGGDADPGEDQDHRVEPELGPQGPVHDIDVLDVRQRVEHRQVRQVLRERDREPSSAEDDRDERRERDCDPVRRVQAHRPGHDERPWRTVPGAEQDDEAADREEQVDAQVAVACDDVHVREAQVTETAGGRGEQVVVRHHRDRGEDPQQVDLVEPAP
jgi:hypothetical protein